MSVATAGNRHSRRQFERSSPAFPAGGDFSLSTGPAQRLTTDYGQRTIIMAREYVWLECTECNSRNYRTPKETRGTDRLELKKFCNRDRRHTVHKESRKK
jgi:large subunit ribosomal protein L33